ncbi:hypothetical protein [Candidatus Coxiella mudrowiae]|uniref:hypothetical protein n=1 Tax=Candidatus Coxiella mudrowiae TaxID=2054173 RepID=UPI003CC82ABE
MLKENRISAQKVDLPPTAIYFKEPCPVYQLPGFDKGYIVLCKTYQDNMLLIF